MPIITSNPVATYDLETNKTDISGLFLLKNLPDTPFYNLVSEGAPVGSTDVKWFEDPITKTYTRLTEGITSASTTLKIADELNLQKGALLSVDGSQFLVESASGKNLTGKFINIDAPQGTFTASATAMIYLQNNARPEGSEAQDGKTQDAFEVLNYTQILDRSFSVTGTQINSDRQGTLPDFVQYNADKTMDDLRYELASGIWSGVPYKPATNAEARRMGGIYYYTKKYGYTGEITGGLTQKKIDDFLYQARAETRNNLTQMWINPIDLDKFSGMLAEVVTPVMPNGQTLTVGNNVIAYVSKLGKNIAIYTDEMCKAGRIWLGSPSLVKIRPFQNRALSMEELPKTMDGKKFRMLGEYTIEFNPCSTTAYVDLKA